MKIAAVLLAGGASKRMGRPKALLRLGEETFADRLIRVFGAVCDPVVLVLGHDADRIRAGLRRAAEAAIAVNPDPNRGQLSSLQTGLVALPGEVEAAMFTPVDYPALREATVSQLAEAVRTAPLAVPRFEGRNGHPVCLRRELIDEILRLPVEGRARDVVHGHRNEANFVDVTDPGVVDDIDEPADYERLAGRA